MVSTDPDDWLVNEFARLVAAHFEEQGNGQFAVALREDLKKTVQTEIQRCQQNHQVWQEGIASTLGRLETANSNFPSSLRALGAKQDQLAATLINNNAATPPAFVALRDELIKTFHAEAQLHKQNQNLFEKSIESSFERLNAASENLLLLLKKIVNEELHHAKTIVDKSTKNPEPSLKKETRLDHPTKTYGQATDLSHRNGYLSYRSKIVAAITKKRFLLPAVFVFGCAIGIFGGVKYVGKSESQTDPTITKSGSATTPTTLATTQTGSVVPKPSPTEIQVAAKPGTQNSNGDIARVELLANFLATPLIANEETGDVCAPTFEQCLTLHKISVDRLDDIELKISTVSDKNLKKLLSNLSIQALLKIRIAPEMRVDGKLGSKSNTVIASTNCGPESAARWKCLIEKSLQKQ